MKGWMIAALLMPASAWAGQTGPDSWSDPQLPREAATGGALIATDDSDELFFFPGGGTDDFHRLSIATGSWRRMASPSGTVGLGAGATHMSGTPYIYLLRSGTVFGPTTMDRYHIATDRWGSLATPPLPASFSTAVTTTLENRLFVLTVQGSGWSAQSSFWEYSPPEIDPPAGLWTNRGSSSLSFGPGAALCPDESGEGLYGLVGNGFSGVGKYTVASGSWGAIGSFPTQVSAGAAMVRTGSGTLLAFPGGTGGLFEYDPDDNAWTLRSEIPGWTTEGAALACPPGSSVVFSAAGGGNRALWRYSTADRWFLSTLARAPLKTGYLSGAGGDLLLTSINSAELHGFSVSDGTWTPKAAPPRSLMSLVHGGDGMWFGTPGSSDYLYRYSVDLDSWDPGLQGQDQPALPPAGAYGSESRLIAPGDGSLRLLANRRVFRYSIPDNTWNSTSSATAPRAILSSSAAHGGGDRIYVLAGNHFDALLAYSLSRDEWITTLPPLPEIVTYSASLFWPGSGDLLYALGETGHLYTYSMAGNTWTLKASAPGLGGRMAYVGQGPHLHVVGSRSNDLWRYEMENLAPIMTTLGQRRMDGRTILPSGGMTPERGMTISTRVEDPDHPGPITIEVEVRKLPDPLSGTPTQFHPGLPAGVDHLIPVQGLDLDASYTWQIRVRDGWGKESSWRRAGGGAFDFATRTNSVPALTGLGQFIPASGKAIPAGDSIFTEGGVILSGDASDLDGDERVFEVELQRLGTPFTGNPTLAVPVPAGGSAVSAVLPINDRPYHWRARVTDAMGTSSAWTSFGGNDENEADFKGMALGSASKSRCQQSGGSGIGGLAVLLIGLAIRRK